MKDASSVKLASKVCLLPLVQHQNSKLMKQLLWQESHQMKSKLMNYAENNRYQFDEGERKILMQLLKCSKQVTNLSVMILNTMVKDKAEGREHELAKIEIRHENEMANKR